MRNHAFLCLFWLALSGLCATTGQGAFAGTSGPLTSTSRATRVEVGTIGSVPGFRTAELRRYLDRFVRGSNGYTSERRVKLMKMLWDAVGSEFGSRHELYEVNYTGNHEDIRRQALSYLNASGIADELKAFAESAMAEYDLNGWTVSDLITPDDVNVIRRK